MIKRFLRILLIAFIIILGVSIYYSYIKKDELKHTKLETIGILVSFSECGVLMCYDYTYDVNGVSYDGRLKTNILIPECRYGGDCKGRRFRVWYSSVDPNNSRLDLNMEYQ